MLNYELFVTKINKNTGKIVSYSRYIINTEDIDEDIDDMLEYFLENDKDNLYYSIDYKKVS